MMHWYAKGNHLHTVAVDLGLEKKVQRVEVYTQEDMGPVLGQLDNWMRLFGYSSKDLFAVRLALTEAMTNAIKHGNGKDPNKLVLVSYLVSSMEVLIEVQDQGRGFKVDGVLDPLAEKNLDRIGGRGLFLMRVYTSWISFNEQGNRVTFCRLRSGCPAEGQDA